ncbi:hypothetical protein BKA67DRAFT_580640 [Truncatella angustata]|uniref:Ferric oxidoreductase domain-containing protein n=1 Tax=Truncatella angustata TaxID=152316 RepID=A0A9P8RM79_9PEZI|nr:uncharacterized protein BKA67DRAFT_580640 [Truncatella angustata]KAH6646813.1 hypothetical protein BKA67DRAFT_580640 [Truncatella angustata]
MDISISVYVITLYGCLATAGLCVVLQSAYHRWVKPRITFSIALVQNTFIFKSYVWVRLTFLQICIIIPYLMANGIALGFKTRDLVTLETRSSTIALFNLVLLSFSGHAHQIAEMAGLSLAMYRFLHRWVGRVMIVEALLHMVLIIIHRQVVDDLFKSGCIAAGGLLAILLSSLWFPRQLRNLFDKLHSAFYVTTMTGLLWHVGFPKSTVASITVGVSGGLWLIMHLRQLITLAVCYYSGGLAKTIDTVWMDEAVTRIQLTGQAVRVFPGCYFYVYFRGPLPLRNFLHGYRMMPMPDAKEAISGKVSTMDFLISHTGQHGRSIMGVRKGQDLLLIGPYGKDLQLHRFETVILTARGIGILGVLPFALQLAGRKQQDSVVRDKESRLRDSDDAVFRDVTRKVDLIWWLDHNEQENWVADQLRELQASDQDNKLLVVWCVYPAPRREPPPFKPNDHWQMLYNFDKISLSREIRQEARYPGRMIVSACGDQDFVDGVRSATMDNISPGRVITFEQLDYRPRRSAKTFPSDSVAQV